jgi:hypothetical protein
MRPCSGRRVWIGVHCIRDKASAANVGSGVWGGQSPLSESGHLSQFRGHCGNYSDSHNILTHETHLVIPVHDHSRRAHEDFEGWAEKNFAVQAFGKGIELLIVRLSMSRTIDRDDVPL